MGTGSVPHVLFACDAPAHPAFLLVARSGHVSHSSEPHVRLEPIYLVGQMLKAVPTVSACSVGLVSHRCMVTFYTNALML